MFEFHWQASKSYKDKANIFVHVLDHHYSPPEKCWKDPDWKCTGFDFEAMNDGNPVITPQNIHERAWILVSMLQEYATWYRTRNLLVPFGNDFRYVTNALLLIVL